MTSTVTDLKATHIAAADKEWEYAVMNGPDSETIRKLALRLLTI